RQLSNPILSRRSHRFLSQIAQIYLKFTYLFPRSSTLKGGGKRRKLLQINSHQPRLKGEKELIFSDLLFTTYNLQPASGNRQLATNNRQLITDNCQTFFILQIKRHV